MGSEHAREQMHAAGRSSCPAVTNQSACMPLQPRTGPGEAAMVRERRSVKYQWGDVLGVLMAQADRLTARICGTWATKLGVLDLLRRACTDAALDLDSRLAYI